MNNGQKGICRLSVVPMRAKPSLDAILISELLFGEHYTVLEEKKGMLKIELDFDGSAGWIDKDQYSPISDEYFRQINLSDYKVCVDLSGTIFFQKKHVHILFGSILPITTNELFKLEEQIAFNGESKSMAQKREFEYMLEILKKFLHAPYRQGGKTPFGVDEGGFIQQVFKVCGYRLPRTISELRNSGQEVQNTDEILPGDLVFPIKASESAYIYLGGTEYTGIHKGQVALLRTEEIGEKEILVRRILYKNVI